MPKNDELQAGQAIRNLIPAVCTIGLLVGVFIVVNYKIPHKVIWPSIIAVPVIGYINFRIWRKSNSDIAFKKGFTLWFPKPVLNTGENIQVRASANLLRMKSVVGGQVSVTNQRFIFVHNILDAMYGRVAIAIDRDEIDSTEILPSGWKAVRARGKGAMLYSQRKITTKDNENLVIVVRNIHKLRSTISI